MMTQFNRIRALPFFKNLSDDALATHLNVHPMRIKTYGKNTVLHFEGESCQYLEIILSGSVVVERIDESGNALTISEFSQHDILGGSLLFSTQPRYPMMVTTQTEAEILEIHQDVLFELFLQNPLFLRDYLELISDHASILGNTIRHYVQTTIRESLLHYLNYERAKQNSMTIVLPLSKKALAEKIGVERTSLSRELAKMRAEGLISFDRKTITLLKS